MTNDNSNYWVEWSNNAKHGLPPVFVKLDDISKNVGFRSLYAYDTDTAKYMLSQGSVSGVGQLKPNLYSDTLFIDIDDDPRSAQILIEQFEQMHIQCEIYTSGNRSTHIHVPIVPMTGPYVPHSQKEFLQNICLCFGINVDMSIYHATGLYRLNGTVHDKTGRPKKLMDKLPGTILEIEYVEPNVHQSIYDSDNRTLWRMLLTHKKSGGRQFHVWKIGRRCRELGYSPDKTIELMKFWNENYCEPPLEISQVVRKMR